MNTKIHWNENFLNKNSSPCHSRVLLLNWFSVSVLHSGLCLVHRSKKETRNKVQWCNGITNANKQSLVTRRDVIVFTSVWSPLGNIFKSCSRLQAKHAALYLKVKITWNEKRVTGDGNTEPLVQYAQWEGKKQELMSSLSLSRQSDTKVPTTFSQIRYTSLYV